MIFTSRLDANPLAESFATDEGLCANIDLTFGWQRFCLANLVNV